MANSISDTEYRLDFVVLSDLNGTTINCIDTIIGVSLSTTTLQLTSELETIYCLKLGKLEKCFPLQGERAHSLYFWSFQKQNREEVGQNNNNRPINLLMVVTFSTYILQVHNT